MGVGGQDRLTPHINSLVFTLKSQSVLPKGLDQWTDSSSLNLRFSP